MKTWKLYGIQCGEFIKIGISLDIPRRLYALKLGNPMPCTVVLRRNPPYAGSMERKMHQHLADRAVGREWFRITPKEARDAYNLLVGEFNQMLADDIKRDLEYKQKNVEAIRRRALEEANVLI